MKVSSEYEVTQRRDEEGGEFQALCVHSREQRRTEGLERKGKAWKRKGGSWEVELEVAEMIMLSFSEGAARMDRSENIRSGGQSVSDVIR